MSAATDNLRVLSLVPGRLRLHLPGLTAGDTCQLQAWLCQVQGVKRVRANPLTGNVLIHFDRTTTDEQRLLAELHEAWGKPHRAAEARRATHEGTRKPSEWQGRSASSLLGVGVRGLLGHAAVDSLWFAAGFLGASFGLPLAGLGPLHVVMDIAVWGVALKAAHGEPPGDKIHDGSGGPGEGPPA